MRQLSERDADCLIGHSAQRRGWARPGHDHNGAEWFPARWFVDLGALLGLGVTAEGIEEAQQLARLRAMGCEMVLKPTV